MMLSSMSVLKLIEFVINKRMEALEKELEKLQEISAFNTEMTKTHLLTWAATMILLTLAGAYGQWTYIDYHLECMLLPLQFRMYMNWKNNHERASKVTMCFTNAVKTAALQGTKDNSQNDIIQMLSAAVLTWKTKSSRQLKTMSITIIMSEFGGKVVHPKCWFCDINGEFPQACVWKLPHGRSQ